MERQRSILRILALGLLLGLPLSCFAMSNAGETVTQRGVVDDDYYAAGSKVDIDADIAGDLVAAGGDLFLGKRVQADVIAAGGSINLRGEVGDDVRVAGGEITIEANIGDDLVAAGGEIRVTSGTTVGGDAWLAGGDVYIDGTINKDLVVGAGTIKIAGIVHGNVTIEGGELHLLNNAVIDGDLLYKSPEKATIDPDAKITGTVTYAQSDWDRDESEYGIFFLGTMLVASIVLFLLFPGFTVSAARKITAQPWQSLGLGLILLIVTPIIAIVLVSIVLGFWVGLVTVALYLVALPVGFLIGCFFLGDWGASLMHKEISTKSRRILSVAIVIVLLGLIQLIPVLGGLLFFVLLLLGLGAVLLQIQTAYKQPSVS